jgi:hypothetical protein
MKCARNCIQLVNLVYTTGFHLPSSVLADALRMLETNGPSVMRAAYADGDVVEFCEGPGDLFNNKGLLTSCHEERLLTSEDGEWVCFTMLMDNESCLNIYTPKKYLRLEQPACSNF